MVATTKQWFPGEWCHHCWAFSLLGVRRLKYCTFVSYQLYFIFVLCQGIKSLCLQLSFSIRCEDIKRLSFNILHSFLGVLFLFRGSGSDLLSLSFYILHFDYFNHFNYIDYSNKSNQSIVFTRHLKGLSFKMLWWLLVLLSLIGSILKDICTIPQGCWPIRWGIVDNGGLVSTNEKIRFWKVQHDPLDE